jgi:hypothetical protein
VSTAMSIEFLDWLNNCGLGLGSLLSHVTKQLSFFYVEINT